MSADFLLPAILLGALSAICLANAIHVLRMTPWEYEQEWRRLNPDTALRRDLGVAMPSDQKGTSDGPLP